MRFCILILGGYGVFGRLIAQGLCRDTDVRIIIAGRQEAKLQAIANELGVETLRFDPIRDSGDRVKQQGVQLVINCGGPFQERDYTFAETCIDLGIHYIDLADNRAYVQEFDALSMRAQENGVIAITGASTVPAVSSAMMDYFLINGFKEIHTLEYGVTPGNRTERGVATVRAILSYVGKPFNTLVRNNLQRVYGWQSLHRETVAVLGKRWMSNCDVPDLDIFPMRYPALRTQRFYAGLELSVLHVGLWLLSWLVRWKIIKSYAPYAKWFRELSLQFYDFGTDTGAMYMKLRGVDSANKPIYRRWYLIARAGHGPQIPATPAIILARKIMRGELKQAGAYSASGCITRGELLSALKNYAIEEVIPTGSLYQNMLLGRYAVLPQAVQRLHAVDGEIKYSGRAEVKRGRGYIVNLLADLLSLPKAGSNVDVNVHIEQQGDKEIWTRHFNGQKFRSVQWHKGGLLYERLPLTTLVMAVETSQERLRLELQQVYVFGLPVAGLLRPKVTAVETQQFTSFCFHIKVELPLLGLLVEYKGALNPDA